MFKRTQLEVTGMTEMSTPLQSNVMVCNSQVQLNRAQSYHQHISSAEPPHTKKSGIFCVVSFHKMGIEANP